MLALAFSGGKDSMACWYLYRQQQPIVLWVNTGKAYPETISIINRVRQDAHRFVELMSDQQSQVEEHGLPSDLVPIDNTVFGAQFSRMGETRIQSYLQCCHDNIWKPLMDGAKAHGVTQLICGQRDEDSHKAPVRNGHIVDGIQRLQPIEKWTSDEVLAYLREQMGELPEHYALEHSSMDCYDCTAYAAHSHDRVAYMRERHPALYADYSDKLTRLCAAINTPLEHYRRLLLPDVIQNEK